MCRYDTSEFHYFYWHSEWKSWGKKLIATKWCNKFPEIWPTGKIISPLYIRNFTGVFSRWQLLNNFLYTIYGMTDLLAPVLVSTFNFFPSISIWTIFGSINLSSNDKENISLTISFNLSSPCSSKKLLLWDFCLFVHTRAKCQILLQLLQLNVLYLHGAKLWRDLPQYLHVGSRVLLFLVLGIFLSLNFGEFRRSPLCNVRRS